MDIQLLKSRLDIIAVAHELGIEVGKSDKALCPFHDDKIPSLQFSREKQICTCFSSGCGAGTMDVVALVQKKNDWSLPETLKWLQMQSGEIERTVEPSISLAKRIELLENLFPTFTRSFAHVELAKQYVQNRGLDASKMQLGYNLGKFHRGSKEIADYEKLGLLKKCKTGYLSFGKGCLVFPLKNEADQITGLYFRETDTSKAVQHYYLKNRSGLYPHYPKAARIVLAESIIVAETIRQHTNCEVLACYGTEGTAEQLQALKNHEALKEVIIFFDGDLPGREGAEKLQNQLEKLPQNPLIKMVETPEGEDASSIYEKSILSA